MKHATHINIWLFPLLICLLTLLSGTPSLSQVPPEGPSAEEGTKAAPVVSSISITIQGDHKQEDKWREMAENLLFVQVGDTFSPAMLEETLEAMKLCKQFQAIDADTVEEEEGIGLVFSLKPFDLIKDIKIHGEHPVFEKEIVNEMTIYPGDAFVPEDLHKQIERIEAFLKGSGYIAPAATVTAEKDPKDGYYVVLVELKKGAYYSLRHIAFSGNHSFSALRLKMKLWRASLLVGSAGRFEEGNLKKGLEKLTKFYWKKGYPDCAINSTLDKDSETGDVSFAIDIHEGPQYKVEISGNEHFRSCTLKKQLVLAKTGNKSNLGVRKSAENIKKHYRNAGYLEAKVKVAEEMVGDDGKPVKHVRFAVKEGPGSVVERIRITGNDTFDDEKLNKQMLTRLPGWIHRGAFVPETLEGDLLAIKTLYLIHGFPDAEIKDQVEFNKDNQAVSVDIDIDEGKQVLVSSLKVTGVTMLSEEEVDEAIKLKKGTPFRRFMLQSDKNSLSALISEKGHPYVKVMEKVHIHENGFGAELEYVVDEGPYVEMGEIYYSGNFRTKDKILANELEIKPGEPFSLARMLEGQRNIRDLDIFNAVKFKTIGLKEKADKINLFAEIEEKKPYFLHVGGGYETQKGFFGKARVGDHNLFGTNKDVWIGGEVSFIGYLGEFEVREPRLFGSRVATTFSVFGERKEEFNQAFGTTTYGSSLGFGRKCTKDFALGLNFRLERREQFKSDSYDENSPDALSEQEFEPRTIFVTTPSINYDSRDSFVRPKKGIFSTLSVDVSQGLDNPLDDFLRYRFDLRFYFTPAKRLTLAWLGRVGYLDPYGTTRFVPQDQLFFLGGTLSVRGFRENLLAFDSKNNPVGGRLALVGSMEARIDVGYNFEVVTFFDAGRVSETYTTPVSKNFRSSVGGGLRYITPIGPIGVLYGIKLDRLKDEDFGQFHFTIGYTF
jgi:outer membrane protein insertion porin family